MIFAPPDLIRLADPGSFHAVDAAGTVGWATLGGVAVLVFASDFSVCGGSTDAVRAGLWLDALERAEVGQIPLIGFYHGGGARIQDGGVAVAAYAGVLAHLARSRCFSIAVLTGPCAGGDALAPQVCDILFTVSDGGLRLSRAPDTCVYHQHFADVASCFAALRPLIAFTRADAAVDVSGAAPEQIIDSGTESVLHKGGLRCSLARILGQSVAMVTLQDGFDGADLLQAAALVRLCDKMDWPFLVKVTGSGFKPDAGQAALAIGARDVMRAMAQARCHKIAVITGAAYGAAYALFATRPLVDDVLAWPTAAMAAVPAETAARLIKPQDKAAFLDAYTRDLLSPDYGLHHGLVDTVLEPAETRAHLAALFANRGPRS